MGIFFFFSPLEQQILQCGAISGARWGQNYFLNNNKMFFSFINVEGVIQKLHSVKYWIMITVEADTRNQKPHIKEIYKNENNAIILLEDIGSLFFLLK